MTISVDIRKRLAGTFVLETSFTAPSGITVLFGASGSGKTTILRCLAGLTRPDLGRIAFGDRVVFDARERIDVPVERRRVGYVFQQLALFPHKSIRDNIGYALNGLTYAERRDRIGRVAEAFAIANLLDRRPDQVSGGERQRAALARALVSDPAVLLLDEPLAALDYRIRSRIMDDLRRWNDTHGIPLVYVTHSHEETFALGDHLVIVEDGRVLETGSPHEVLDRPTRGALATLAGFENLFDATVVAASRESGTMQCRLGDSDVAIEVPFDETPVGAAVRIGIRAGDILLASEHPRGLSARNVLRGSLAEVTVRGPGILAIVDAGARFAVLLTPGGLSTLGISPGGSLWLVIKTYSCRVLAR